MSVASGHRTQLYGGMPSTLGAARRRPASVAPCPTVRAPVAGARPVTTTHHGRDRVDDYEWLRDKDDPEVTAYLEAENAYTEARTAHLADLRQAIFEEIKARTRETDLSVPTRRRGYWYYSPHLRGQGVRRQLPGPVTDPDDWTPPKPAEDCAPDQPALPGEEVLLDLNELAEGHEFFSLGGSAISLDGPLLAYWTDTSRRRALHGPGQGPRTGELLARRDHRRARRRHLGPATASTSTTRPSTRPGAPTRSGGTGSAPTRPTTSSSTTRPTGGSGSASAGPAATGS